MPSFWLFSLRGVEQLVKRQDEVGAVRDENPAGSDDPAGRELVELAEECLGLEHDAVADDAGNVGVEDPRGNLAQDEVRVADDHGVAGVGAPLIPDDEVGLLSQNVDQLALALVSPLRSDDHHTGGLLVEHAGSPDGPMKRAPHGAPESSGKPMLAHANSQFATRARPTRSAVSSESPSGVSAGV